MGHHSCTLRSPDAGRLTTEPTLRVEWLESAHDHETGIQLFNVGGFGTLLIAIGVLCAGVLSEVLAAAMMMAS